jgi:hypothetical protein
MISMLSFNNRELSFSNLKFARNFIEYLELNKREIKDIILSGVENSYAILVIKSTISISGRVFNQ